MQKKLIVLAIASLASASAFADSTVNVYGVLDAAVVGISADGQKSQTVTLSGGLAASRLGVKAVEELEGGTKAVAVAEYGINDETSDGLAKAAARQQMLALAGDWGTLATGYLQTTGYDFGSKYDVTAGSDVSPLQNITVGAGMLIGAKAGATRANNALAYISPSMGGFTINLNYSTDLSTGLGLAGKASTDSTSNWATAALVGLYYDNGPLSVGLVNASTNNNVTTTANVNETALGVSYAMDVATIKATYQTSAAPNAVGTNATSSNTAYSIGAVIPAASGAVALSYAAGAINNVANSYTTTGYTVGFLKPMSKTTTAYIAYSAQAQSAGSAFSVDNSALAGATLTAGGNSSVIALGLQKKF
jgi:predicted porin